MKIRNALAAAGLLMSAVVAAAPAEARDHGRYEDDRFDRRDYRHDRGRHYGWDRGRRYGYRYRRCWTEYRHHRAYRVCR